MHNFQDAKAAKPAKTARSPAQLRTMFGTNLRHLTQSYSSISELARQLGINRTQFNRYMSGESFPRPDILDRICNFFEVDARILLEPVETIGRQGQILNGPFLSDFLGHGIRDLNESAFPSGFYRFTRRSFVSSDQFVIGLVYAFRSGTTATFIKGYEAREAMRYQGLSESPTTREFRGVVTAHEDGVAFIISRRHAMTYSFNYLARVGSMENNFWLGYVARTVRDGSGERVTRMVYEHLGDDRARAREAARSRGFAKAEDLLPYHRHLLRPDEPFR
ncbi:helix-turn-helix domain-containing protein [Pseudophaeobacter sp.]|uniref:helix-turn-helix domain-containing protein n=1 Tax=Pseudophaeobacter sp. TaxID=1971739 RepID=UPI004058D529